MSYRSPCAFFQLCRSNVLEARSQIRNEQLISWNCFDTSKFPHGGTHARLQTCKEKLQLPRFRIGIGNGIRFGSPIRTVRSRAGPPPPDEAPWSTSNRAVLSYVSPRASSKVPPSAEYSATSFARRGWQFPPETRSVRNGNSIWSFSRVAITCASRFVARFKLALLCHSASVRCRVQLRGVTRRRAIALAMLAMSGVGTLIFKTIYKGGVAK